MPRFAPARNGSPMIDRFLNWGDHGKPKSGKIRGRCQLPLEKIILNTSHISWPAARVTWSQVLRKQYYLGTFSNRWFNCIKHRQVQFKCNMHIVHLLINLFLFIYLFLFFVLCLMPSLTHWMCTALQLHSNLDRRKHSHFLQDRVLQLHWTLPNAAGAALQTSFFASTVTQLLILLMAALSPFWKIKAFSLSMSSLSDNSSKASLIASFDPRNLERELSWAVISSAPFALGIFLYRRPWDDEKTSKTNTNCETQKRKRNKKT